MSIDRASVPFILLAAIPAAVSLLAAPLAITIALLLLPMAIALFFRDPDRSIPAAADIVVSPADGTVTHAGPARPGEAPPGEWRQVTVFLSVLDVHINRTPVSGRVTRVHYVPGSFRAAFHREAFRNEHSEIWVDHQGIMIVFRQVVGVLARRVVCRINEGDELTRGQRIGLMKFGSRMDVFVPMSATLAVSAGDRVVAGETVLARLPPGLTR